MLDLKDTRTGMDVKCDSSAPDTAEEDARGSTYLKKLERQQISDPKRNVKRADNREQGLVE